MEALAIFVALATIIGGIYGSIQLYEWLSRRRRQVRQARRQREQSVAPTGPFRLLNFAHPITPGQKDAIERWLEVTVETIVDQPLHLDHDDSFEEQVRQTVASVPLTSEEWQKADFVVNVPGFAPATAVLLAELHGRMGHFPTVIRLRPVPNSSPQAYELAEVINLQTVRDGAREQR